MIWMMNYGLSMIGAFSKTGGRGKHLAEYRSGTNLVLLDPDVAKAYPTAEAVNDALRRLMQSSGAA